MTAYQILAICGLLIQTFGYLIAFRMIYGFWPTSYSNTAKHLESTPTKKGIILEKGYIFTFWTALGILFLLPGLLKTSQDLLTGSCAYMSMFYLGLVGAYPSNIDKITTKWHCRFAKLCAILAVVWLLLQHIYTPTLIIFGVMFAWSRLFQRKYETLIMEMAAFISAYTGILILG